MRQLTDHLPLALEQRPLEGRKQDGEDHAEEQADREEGREDHVQEEVPPLEPQARLIHRGAAPRSAEVTEDGIAEALPPGRRHRHAEGPIPARLLMQIAASGDEQAKLISDHQQARPLRLGVGPVEDLHAIQAALRQRLQQRSKPLSVRRDHERVREEGPPARLVDQVDRIADVQPAVLSGVAVRRAVGAPIGERSVHGARFGLRRPRPARGRERIQQARVVRLKAEGEQMDLLAIERHCHLDAGDGAHLPPPRSALEGGEAGDGVMVGQGRVGDA